VKVEPVFVSWHAPEDKGQMSGFCQKNFCFVPGKQKFSAEETKVLCSRNSCFFSRKQIEAGRLTLSNSIFDEE